MRFARVAAIGVVAAAVGFGWIWSRSGSVRTTYEPATAGVHETPAVAPTPPSVAQAPVAEPVAPATQPEAIPPHSAFPDPSGDLALYVDRPMSDVPHRVVRGWGLGPRSRRPGYVGALVVVDPAIDLASLKDLVRDIRAYHRGADAVAVRVLDSLEAATYDRHEDGGALLAESVVATVHYSEELLLDETKVRGESIDSDGEASFETEASGEALEAPTDPGEGDSA